MGELTAGAARALIGLPATGSDDPAVLVLGSFPGTVSLARREYYAHPRNRLWSVLARIYDCGDLDPGSAYPARISALRRNRIALWDVLASCERADALDASIRPDTAVANDFDEFFARHPALCTVLLNGGAAATWFSRLVLHQDVWADCPITVIPLPSTSPANARWSLDDLARQWRSAALGDILMETRRAPSR